MNLHTSWKDYKVPFPFYNKKQQGWVMIEFSNHFMYVSRYLGEQCQVPCQGLQASIHGFEGN